MRSPYVTGAYVTGPQHYGRETLLDYLLHGPSQAYWVVGSRRIGKTSLLRQLESLATVGGPLIPLFWDMQGCDTFNRLGQYLADVVRDSGDDFSRSGLVISEGDDLFNLLANLRRALQRANCSLFLLCDETEVLIKIAHSEPEAMQRLHRELTGGTGLRVVMASTRAIYQMNDVCRDWPTAPFLDGFDMSQTLGSLSYHSARALITQAQAPVGEQVRAASEVIDTVCDYTNDHPYLIQLLCSRLFQEEGYLRPVVEHDLEVGPMLKGLFSYDFNSLTAADRQLIGLLSKSKAGALDEAALQKTVKEQPAELQRRLHNLESLGYLRRFDGQVAIANRFLANWLAARRSPLKAIPLAGASEEAMQAAFEQQQTQETSFLAAQLTARRARLVELEAIRARDLLSVSPQVLAEIEQTQTEIKELRRLALETLVGVSE